MCFENSLDHFIARRKFSCYFIHIPRNLLYTKSSIKNFLENKVKYLSQNIYYTVPSLVLENSGGILHKGLSQLLKEIRFLVKLTDVTKPVVNVRKKCEMINTIYFYKCCFN
jgi:hypothetical protein